MFSLQVRTVVVTGGGRGIGRGIARACGRAGAQVVITGRTLAPLRETGAELAALGADHLLVPGDIMSMAGLDEIVAKATERFGAIDGWVNNAGSANAGDVGPMLGIDEGQWDRVVDDVGPFAVYFLSDESSWVSGTVVPVHGGSRIPIGLLTYLHHKNKDIAV